MRHTIFHNILLQLCWHILFLIDRLIYHFSGVVFLSDGYQKLVAHFFFLLNVLSDCVGTFYFLIDLFSDYIGTFFFLLID